MTSRRRPNHPSFTRTPGWRCAGDLAGERARAVQRGARRRHLLRQRTRRRTELEQFPARRARRRAGPAADPWSQALARRARSRRHACPTDADHPPIPDSATLPARHRGHPPPQALPRPRQQERCGAPPRVGRNFIERRGRRSLGRDPAMTLSEARRSQPSPRARHRRWVCRPAAGRCAGTARPRVGSPRPLPLQRAARR